MKYTSTRGQGESGGAAAIATGIAPDGGLFVPEAFPNIQPTGTYENISASILAAFLPEYGADVLLDFAKKAYSRFKNGEAAPVRKIEDGLYALELWHGPTLAFKDIALTLLPYLLTEAQRMQGADEEIVILVATSGDTGKAALEGFRDVPGTSCAVYYPVDGVSSLQKLQMVTQEGANTHVIAVEGNFDDAQTGVKKLFTDPALKEKLCAQGKAFSSANSINIGRLLPQIAYYFFSYAELVRDGAIKQGEEIVFCVPTGNFGNILAGIYAKKMGLPVKRFVCASNDNNVLTDFLRTGVYDRNRDFHKTSSPSMDILISSNLERLLYEAADRDPAVVRGWMADLAETGRYDIGAERHARLQELLYGGWCDEANCAATIKRVFGAHGYLMDTHTAVAQNVLEQYRAETGDATPAVVVSTASPYKFVEDVNAALGLQGEGDPFTLCDILSAHAGIPVPEQIKALQNAPTRHETVCAVSGMESALLKELAKA